ncbi:hypothetical protein [Streptomyces sp. NPDC055134]
MHPHDEISLAEAQQAMYESYVESQELRAQNAAQAQAKSAQAPRQWLAAIWAQQIRMNQSLNPDGDNYGLYGQRPPL